MTLSTSSGSTRAARASPCTRPPWSRTTLRPRCVPVTLVSRPLLGPAPSRLLAPLQRSLARFRVWLARPRSGGRGHQPHPAPFEPAQGRVAVRDRSGGAGGPAAGGRVHREGDAGVPSRGCDLLDEVCGSARGHVHRSGPTAMADRVYTRATTGVGHAVAAPSRRGGTATLRTTRPSAQAPSRAPALRFSAASSDRCPPPSSSSRSARWV